MFTQGNKAKEVIGLANSELKKAAFRVSVKSMQRLDKYAAKHGKKKCFILNEALLEWLDKNEAA